MSKNATASDNTDGHDDSTDHELQTDGNVYRRQFLGAAGALTALPAASASEVEADATDDSENWEPMDNAVYTTGSFTPIALSSGGGDTVATWTIEDDDLLEREVEVLYDPNAVYLSFEGRNSDMRVGGLAEFSTDKAREIAVALHQAAEEHDRRTEVADV